MFRTPKVLFNDTPYPWVCRVQVNKPYGNSSSSTSFTLYQNWSCEGYIGVAVAQRWNVWVAIARDASSTGGGAMKGTKFRGEVLQKVLGWNGCVAPLIGSSTINLYIESEIKDWWHFAKKLPTYFLSFRLTWHKPWGIYPKPFPSLVALLGRLSFLGGCILNMETNSWEGPTLAHIPLYL